MILIADSGASKTDWACISRETDEVIRFTSQGYNPNYISGPMIIADLFSSMPKKFPIGEVEEIHFYGAGVTELQYPFMTEVLSRVFPRTEKICIAMDTLASCRALLGREAGFAAILGTGTNTCLYDGEKEILNVDSCGFILGDEGSGGYLGKRMIVDYIRRNMPKDVYDMVGEVLGMNNDELLDQIYTRPFPNRFCAQFSGFIHDNLDKPYFSKLVENSFRSFFKKIVVHYPDYQSYMFNSVGSIGYVYKDILSKVAAEYGMKIGKIIKAPLEELINYHRNNP